MLVQMNPDGTIEVPIDGLEPPELRAYISQVVSLAYQQARDKNYKAAYITSQVAIVALVEAVEEERKVQL